MSAATVLREYLAKSGGEGSRGGHIIGHTKSGNPVYAGHKAESADYAGMSPYDHAAAAMMHDLAADKAESLRDAHHHSQIAAGHRLYWEKAVDRQNRKMTPAERLKMGIAFKLPPENPTPEDGPSVGKIFSGRHIYHFRAPHHYEHMLASEYGDASRLFGKLAIKAKEEANDDLATHYGAMRYGHVQAASSQAKIEAKLRGDGEDRHHRHQNEGRRHWGL